PHSSFVQAGAELGIPGLALFVVMIAAAFRALRSEQLGQPRATNRGKRSPLAQSLTAALVGFTVGAFFLSLAYTDLLYTLVALAASNLDWYRWRADQLVARLRALGFDDLSSGMARVVEVGCGPIGIISFFPGRERVGIDPLEPFYSTNPVLTRLRDPLVRYLR